MTTTKKPVSKKKEEMEKKKSSPSTTSKGKSSDSKKKPATAPKKEVSEKPVQKSATKLTPKAGLASRVRIIVKSFDYTMIDEATRLIVETAERNGSLVAGPVPLPTKIKKYTVNRSYFIDKDARDQYEIRTHKRLIDIKEPTTQTIESLQNLSLPAGVNVEIKMI